MANGQVDLKWSHEADGRLNLRWTETGGPAVQKPTRKGFGGRVTEQMIAQLKGETRFAWRAEGLVCESPYRSELAFLPMLLAVAHIRLRRDPISGLMGQGPRHAFCC